MQPEILKFLYDIRVSCESIFEYIGENRDFDSYLKNKLLRRAVERELEIIGEACSNLLKIDPAIRIDNARKIVDARNWVIHGYDKVDDVIIWGIISRDLVILQKQVEQLIDGK